MAISFGAVFFSSFFFLLSSFFFLLSSFFFLLSSFADEEVVLYYYDI
jgi:hypothetical protein